MTKRTPVVLSDNNALHKPLEPGEKLSPDSIPVSAENNNNITVKDDGLFVPTHSGLTTINHDYSLGGAGSAEDPLTVRVSNITGNIIQVRQSADASGGLYVPPAKTLKRKTTSGNFSFNYPDNPAGTSACGKFGTGVYWKTIVTLSQPDSGDTNVMAQAQLLGIPCRSDGTPVPYQLVSEYRAISGSEKPSVMLWLICTEAPTHILDMSTRTVSQMTRGSGTPGGLSGQYPTGSVAVEPRYVVHYMYSAAQ